MLNILIIDDEEKTRHGIKSVINWEMYDIKISGEASNGKEALNLISTTSFDIILTDIRMPVMDGFELIENVKVTHPYIKFIILSGYDDFAYAKKAVKLGASDYILKPCMAEDILETILKVKEKIQLEESKRNMYQRLKNQFTESYPIIKEKYLNRLIKSEYKNIFEFEEKLKFLNIHLNYKRLQVVLIRINSLASVHIQLGNEDFEIMKFAVKNITEELLETQFSCEVFENNDDIVIVLINDEEIEYTSILSALENIKKSISDFAKLSLSIGVGSCYSDIKHLHNSYDEALKAVETKFFIGEDKIVNYDDIREEYLEETSYPLKEESNILESIKSNIPTLLESQMEEFFSALRPDISSKSSILKSIYALLFSLFHFCIERNTSTEKFFAPSITHLLDEFNVSSLVQTKDKLIAISKMINYELNSKKSNNRIFIQLLNYIDENYYKNITRETVAREVYVTPGYVSILFRQGLGINFLEYLHKTRIKHACELLKGTHMKGYEIAYKIGYTDEKYFLQIFKKHIGITPTQYRNKECVKNNL